ncbi:cytochrome P450 [Actinomadura keratinilytica]|uniref:Cytochrome P450 n=1 Tax=Actinomadura keratinilytica TaxID=547461 RepID=A0ABP7Y581_9ACTN
MNHATPRAEAHPPLEQLAVEPLICRDYEQRPAFYYERLRAAHGPVAPVDVLGVPIWLVIGYPQVLDILRDPRDIWSKRLENWRAYTEGRVPADWPLMPAMQADNSIFRDGAELSRLRGAWIEGLRPFQERGRPQARELEHAISQYADDLITVLGEGSGRAGTADLAAQYARPLPLMISNRLLGFTDGRAEDLLMDMWRLVDAGPDAAEAQARLLAAVRDLCARAKTDPGDDLPGHMAAAAPDLTVEELTRELFMVVALIGDYCGTLITGTVLEVIGGDSGARDSVSAGLIQEAVNRAALASPPMANLTLRFPRTDVRMGRYTIAAGDPVILSVAAAHGDPAFTGGQAPDSVYSSRAHVAFGAGPHACVARDLATTITTIAVGRLFERFSMLRLALPPDQLPWRSSPLMRSLRSLPVHYELAEYRTAPAAGGPAAPASPAEPRTEREAQQQEARLSLTRRFLRALRIG